MGIGECTISQGDLVVGDEDGVVVVPQEIEEEAIAAAWKKVHDENVTRDAIRDGLKATEAYAKRFSEIFFVSEVPQPLWSG